MSTFQERLKQVRGKLDQGEMSAQLGIHLTSYGRYERGERSPDLEFIEKVCRTFNVSPTWLILGEGPMHRDEPPAATSPTFHRLWGAVGARNDSELAKALDIEPQAVSSARENNTVPYKWMTIISEKYGISTDWLLYGECPKYYIEPPPAPQPPTSPLDQDLLHTVLAGVKKGLALRGSILPPDKEAQLVALLYDHYAKTRENPDTNTVERYLRLVA